MSDREADANNLLRDQVRVGRQLDGQLLHTRREPGLQLQAALVGGLGNLLEHAPEQRPPHFEIGIQMLALRRRASCRAA